MTVLRKKSNIALIRLIVAHEDKLKELYDAQQKDVFTKNDQKQYIVKLQKENMQLESKLLFFESELKKRMEE